MNKKNRYKNPLLLLLTATIWGVAFVAQSVGMDYVGPFTFNCVRSLLGGIVLLPVIWFLARGKSSTGDASDRVEQLTGDRPADDNTCTSTEYKKKDLWLGGICCGLLLASASSFQQIGIMYTTVGKAGFITACYIILVPIFGLFLKKRCSPLIWVSVMMALIGLYLLCMTGDFSLGKGDIFVFVCAILFTLHILVIDHFSPKVDCVKMSCIQFFVCGISCGVMMLLTEQPVIADILTAWQPIAYAGIMSCGVAYTLQIVGQKGMNPTVASLILSLESCISVLAGWVILGQTLTVKELIGCLFMFAAIVLAQIPTGKKNPSQNTARSENQ